MKANFLFLLPFLFFAVGSSAQNVGIGINSGITARLHVAKADSGLLVLDNTSSFADSAKSKLFFRTNGIYTGAIGTHVENAGTQSARLGFFTYALADPTALYERMSIRDNGNIGIGTVAPTALLDVNGSFRLRNNGAAAGRVLTSDANGNASWQTAAAGLTLPYLGSGSSNTAHTFRIQNTGTSFSAGYFENSNTLNNLYALQGISTNNAGGVGVYGTAPAGTSTITFGVRGYASGTGTAGYGIFGESGNGTGAGGQTNSGYGVKGLAYASGGWGLYAAGFSGANALKTYGGVQMTGIAEGDGKVLTSDGNGNATWQAPGGTGIGFSANLAADKTLSNGVELLITGFSEDFDDGNNFNATNGRFTAPSNGGR